MVRVTKHPNGEVKIGLFRLPALSGEDAEAAGMGWAIALMMFAVLVGYWALVMLQALYGGSV